MLRIIVVGPGLIGKKHIDVIGGSNKAEVVGIVTKASSITRVMSEFPHIQVLSDLSDAIELLSPDGIIVSSPNDTHIEFLEICAKYNCPVLLEKPALVNEDEFIKFTTKFGKRFGKNKVLVGHHRVHSSQLQQATKILESGILGTINGFTGRAAFYKPDFYYKVAPWRTRNPGGGPILINLIHEIQTMRLLIGEIDDLQGFKTSNFRGYDVEDTVSISIMFKNGALGTFFLTDSSVSPFSWELTSGENDSYPYHNDLSCYEIFGSNGTLTIPDLKLYCQNDVDRSWWNELKYIKHQVDLNDPLVEQFNHFINVIQGLALPKIDLEAGITNVRIIDKLKEILE